MPTPTGDRGVMVSQGTYAQSSSNRITGRLLQERSRQISLSMLVNAESDKVLQAIHQHRQGHGLSDDDSQGHRCDKRKCRTWDGKKDQSIGEVEGCCLEILQT